MVRLQSENVLQYIPVVRLEHQIQCGASWHASALQRVNLTLILTLARHACFKYALSFEDEALTVYVISRLRLDLCLHLIPRLIRYERDPEYLRLPHINRLYIHIHTFGVLLPQQSRWWCEYHTHTRARARTHTHTHKICAPYYWAIPIRM